MKIPGLDDLNPDGQSDVDLPKMWGEYPHAAYPSFPLQNTLL